MQLLRNTDGSYRSFSVENPSNDFVNLYISMDKSPKRIRTETLLRKLAKSITQTHPDLTPYQNKRDGTISINWIPVARVTVTSKEDYKIEWHGAASAHITLDKPTILAAVDAGAAAASTVTWSM